MIRLLLRAATLLLAFAMTLAIGFAQRAEAPGARVVRVKAERFMFTPSEVTIAPGTAVEFQLSSDDTAHGFRILGESIDITIPKRGRGTASLTFTPPGVGTYVFECSRMCGAGHSFMRGTIHVKAPAKESR